MSLTRPCFPINCTRTLTCKYNGVQAGFPPQLHEMHHIPKSKGGVAGEDHAWLLEVIAEVSVDAGVMLQFVGLDELGTGRPTASSTAYLFPSSYGKLMDNCILKLPCKLM